MILEAADLSRQPLFISIFILLFSLSCGKQDTETDQKKSAEPSLYSILYNTQNLSITLETDISSLLENKTKDGNHYQSAQLTASNDNNPFLSGQIQVRPRGITRRDKCYFPPLMIKVNNEHEEQLKIPHSENIKLVTYCKDSIGYEQYIIKEYLAYKLYNSISEQSFKVKLINVLYKDTKNEYPDIARLGFIIEPIEEVAERNGCIALDDDAPVKSIHKEKYKTLAMYQYMIGNTDWNFSLKHNIKLIACDPKYGPILVPYDFDYSGLVNTVYSEPHPMFPIDDVTDRLFQWRGSVEEDFTATLEYFNSKKEDFEEIFKNEQLLSSANREEIDGYINSFFDSISSGEEIIKEIKKARKK